MELAIQIATLIAVVLGFAGLIVIIWVFRKQTYMQVVSTYTERYEKLMDLLPKELYMNGSRDLPPKSPELSIACLKYFNFTHEEYYLHENGYFPNDLWKIWVRDIEETLSHPLMLREWKDFQEDFQHHKSFHTFVQQVHK